MSLYPRKFDVYHISSVPRAPEYDSGGNRTFRGHGSDYSHHTDNVVYFMSEPLKRVVAFKAFFESLKINLTKEIETKNDKDKDAILVRQYAGQVEYDVTLNIPAHSVNEAVNNLAKIEELQKLITPLNETRDPDTGQPDFLHPDTYSFKPHFRVMMKNLISSGERFYRGVNFNLSPTEKIIKEMGLPCFIEEVAYQPDVSAGFFEFKNYFYPKNIKLSLKLNMDQTIDTNAEAGAVILPFNEAGEYDEGDRGGFPFGVNVSYDNKKSEKNDLELDSTYNNKTLNRLDFKGERGDGYVFISNGVLEGDIDRPRWIVLKPFLENFSRTNKTDLKRLESKSLNINGGLDPGSDATFGGLKFSFKVNLPAKDIEEAKRNCGKLSYLTRMFFKKQNDISSRYGESNPDGSQENTETQSESSEVPEKTTFVYIPGMLEKAGASRGFPPSTNYSSMLANAVPLYFENLSFDIDMAAGFFEEKGRLYPKAMSLDISLFESTGDLIKNFTYLPLRSGSPYKHINSSVYPEVEHLFPYNRKTFKIGED